MGTHDFREHLLSDLTSPHLTPPPTVSSYHFKWHCSEITPSARDLWEDTKATKSQLDFYTKIIRYLNVIHQPKQFSQQSPFEDSP